MAPALDAGWEPVGVKKTRQNKAYRPLRRSSTSAEANPSAGAPIEA